MDKQSDLQLDALQGRFDLAGKLWLKLDQADWQEAAFVLQSQSDDSALKKAIAKLKVIWVPTEQVSMMQQFVPGKRKQDWMTALPYALEESLSEAVETLQFVAMNRDAEGVVSVAVVAKERMQGWVEQLQSLGLDHTLLVADCFQVAVTQTDSDASEQAWSVYQTPKQTSDETQRYIVRTGEFSGFAGTTEWFEQVKHIQQLQQPDLIIESVAALADSCQTSSTTSRKPCQNFNLRTGEFQAASQESTIWLLWRWPLLMLGLLVVVYLFSISIQTHQHNQQAQAYQSQTEALFKQRFPDVKRIVNIQTQAKTAFAKEGNQLQAGVGPSQLANKIEALFKKYPTVKIQRLDWNDRSAQLLITLQAPQVSALQNLAKEVKAIQSSELKVKNVSQTLAEGVLYVDAN